MVQMPSRASAIGDALAPVRHELEEREHLRRERLHDAARSAASVSSEAFSSAAFRGQRLACRRRPSSVPPRASRFGALDGGREVVALEHFLEHGVLGGLHLGLARTRSPAGPRGIPGWSSRPSPARGTSTAGPDAARRSSRVRGGRSGCRRAFAFAAATASRAAVEPCVERLLSRSGCFGEPAFWRRMRRNRGAGATMILSRSAFINKKAPALVRQPRRLECSGLMVASVRLRADAPFRRDTFDWACPP